MSFLEPDTGSGLNMFKSGSFLVHDARHDELVGKPPVAPKTPGINDVENRLDDQERRRLAAGGRVSTRVSGASAPAGGARPTLTGLG